MGAGGMNLVSAEMLNECRYWPCTALGSWLQIRRGRALGPDPRPRSKAPPGTSCTLAHA